MARRAIGALEAVAPNQQHPSGEAFKTQITAAASNKGLSITRLQSGAETEIGIVFDRADPRLVFFWLEEVETTLGGRITRLSMEQADANGVRVSVDIEGTKG